MSVSAWGWMFPDVQVAEQLFKIVRKTDVVIMFEYRQEQGFPEFARANEKLITVRFLFELLYKAGFVHIDVILSAYLFKITLPARESLWFCCFHLLKICGKDNQLRITNYKLGKKSACVLRAEQIVDGFDGIEGFNRHFYKDGIPVAHRTVP